MHIIVVKARTLIIAALILLIIPALFFAPRAVPAFSPKEDRAAVTDKADTGLKKIALTFDCRDTDEGINRILNTLSEQKGTAAFFVNAELARDFPKTVKAIFDAGHIVAALCDSAADLAKTDAAISNACGAVPLYVRSGESVPASDRVLIGSSRDVTGLKTETAVLKRLVDTAPGDIIKMSSDSELTGELLTKIMKGLGKTYEFVSLDELFS